MITPIDTSNAQTTSVPAERAATRILVVGHDEATGALLTENFEAPGFAVEIAAGGEEALTRIRQYPPDVMVVDATMPGLHDWAFPGTTPIVALSSREQLSEVLTRDGVWVCLVKPVQEDVLIQAVHRIAYFRSPM